MFRIKTDIRQYKCDSPDKVEKLIRNWVIRPTDLIFSAENADWSPIGEHPTFIPLFDVLNEQLRNEPDTLVTRNPFVAPPTAPEGVEINRADSDEITQMTHRTQALRSADDDTTAEISLSDATRQQATEPERKIGRHDLPEELFATAEIHGSFSRDHATPPLDELAELSEVDPKPDDESTIVVEYTPQPDDEPNDATDSTTTSELDPLKPDNLTPEELEPEELKPEAHASDDYERKFTETIQSSAFTRASTWQALGTTLPEENDDDLILAEDFSTTSELTAQPKPNDVTETQEFPVPEEETADFITPASLLASATPPEALAENTSDSDEKPLDPPTSENTSDSDDTTDTSEDSTDSTPEAPSENTSDSDDVTDASPEPEESEESEDDEQTPEDTTTEIPEGYTVDLPPIGPTDEDIAIGIHRSTTTDQEKERTFHTPAPQPLSLVIKETFHFTAATSVTKPVTTLDLPIPALSAPDQPTRNNKTATYIVAAVVLIIAIVIVAALTN